MNERKSKVMVVDDDESVRESLCKLLVGEGYRVILAANGLEAAAALRRERNQMDLLLVDLNLPLKNGWITLNQLLEVNPSLKIFIITGISHQTELARNAGVSALVEKPIDVPAFLRLIREQLAETVRAGTGVAASPQSSFRHLPAAHDEPDASWVSHDEASHSHWGLNE